MIDSPESENLTYYLDKYDKARRQILEHTKKYLIYLSTHLFEIFPIEKITLRGYTPSFNDGDICYFRSNLEYPDVEFTEDKANIIREEWTNEPDDETEKQYKEICEYFSLIPAWVLEELYNSQGFELIINKGSITEEDYCCDY